MEPTFCPIRRRDLVVNTRLLMDEILDFQLLNTTKFDSIEQHRFEDALERNLENKQFIDLRWFKLLIESLNSALSNFTN